MRKLKVLIGCEESQEICKAFRKLGHEAYSCDLKPCSGGHPEWHLQMDVFKAIKLKKWDLVILHPPCTFLSLSSAKHLYINGKLENGKDLERWNSMYKAVEFFNQCLEVNCDRVVIENPIQHGYAKKLIFKKYNQIIEPYWFGHLESKATCLWIKNLPLLHGTNYKFREMMKQEKKVRQRIHYTSNSTIRSKTYPNIAEAMAIQWSNAILNNYPIKEKKKLNTLQLND